MEEKIKDGICCIDENWKRSYIEEHIRSCNENAKWLIQYQNLLKSKIDDIKMDNIDNSFQNVLDDGLYRDFFGVDKNATIKDITGCVRDTCFMKFVKIIKLQTDKIINFGDGDLPTRFFNIKHNPCDNGEENIIKDLMEKDRLFSLIKDFYKNVFHITVNCNKQTKLIYTFHRIKKVYMEYAYPELKDNNKFDKLKTILGLEIFIPTLNSIIKDEFFYLPEESFGGLIYRLNDIIWEYFAVQNLSKNIPNIRECYYTDVEFLGNKKLDIETCRRTLDGYINYTYNLSGSKYRCVEYNRNGVYRGTSTLYSRGSGDCDISMEKVFNEIAPLLFVGLLDVDQRNDDICFNKNRDGTSKFYPFIFFSTEKRYERYNLI